MPLIRFETTVAPEDRTRFTEWVTEQFADVMDTGTGHVGVSIRVCDRADLSLGRAGDEDEVVLVDADVRAGRTKEQLRLFFTSILEVISEQWSVSSENIYLVYTEHEGRDFHLSEAPLASWEEDESETGARRETE